MALAPGAFFGAERKNYWSQKETYTRKKRRIYYMDCAGRVLQTRWQPSSPTVISARPSLTRKERANKFSTVCAKEFLFNIKFWRLTFLFFLRISNIVAIFLSVSVFPSVADSSSCRMLKKCQFNFGGGRNEGKVSNPQ